MRERLGGRDTETGRMRKDMNRETGMERGMKGQQSKRALNA